MTDTQEPADDDLHFMFRLADVPHMYRPAMCNGDMIRDMIGMRALRSQQCVEAFVAVDRKHFWPESAAHMESVFADTPLRHGKLHISAPQIYAEALESLQPLTPNMSFLNVGSGTGYFNSLVGELTGHTATNHGIDIWDEVLDYAHDRCATMEKPKTNIEFFYGNVYQLDVRQTMRYDRIYLGACANSRSKYLYRLLEVGGILVGPFQAGPHQQLRRVVRWSETEFRVQNLESVRFASLIEPSRSVQVATPSFTFAPRPRVERRPSSSSDDTVENTLSSASDAAPELGLPGVPFTFALREKPWTPMRCCEYPTSFRRTVSLVLRSRSLPREIWIQHVLPWCPRSWFEAPAIPIAAERLEEENLVEQEIEHDAITPKKEAQETVDELSDDGVSTQAPSSTQTTPELGPGQPPLGSLLGQDALDSISEEELYEVFGNGQRHVIGAEGDPDDLILDEPRLPLHVLQLSQLLHGVRDQNDESTTEVDEDQDMNDTEDAYELSDVHIEEHEEHGNNLSEAATEEQTV